MKARTWDEINSSFKEKHPNILSLIDLILSLPASSAICEQGFSVMKHVKTDWRSRLTSPALTDQLRIILESPTIKDFEPDEAINLWYNAGLRGRRVDQEPYGPRIKDVATASSNELDDSLSDSDDSQSVCSLTDSDDSDHSISDLDYDDSLSDHSLSDSDDD